LFCFFFLPLLLTPSIIYFCSITVHPHLIFLYHNVAYSITFGEFLSFIIFFFFPFHHHPPI
jgi:hypothetical protein